MKKATYRRKSFGVYSFRGLEPPEEGMSIFRGSMAVAGRHGTGRAYISRHKHEVRKPVRIV